MKNFIVVAILSMFALTGCAQNNMQYKAYNILGQDIQVPAELMGNDDESNIIKRACRVRGNFRTDKRTDRYITFKSNTMPYCNIGLGQSAVIEEIRYINRVPENIITKAMDIAFLPITILGKAIETADGGISGVHGVKTLGVYKDSEYGYAYEGQKYEFEESQRNNIVVKYPFGNISVDNVTIAIVALYMPTYSEKPREINGFTHTVEIKIKKNFNNLENVVTWVLKNRDDIIANNALLLQYAKINSNYLSKVKSIDGLKISSDYLVSFIQQDKKATTETKQKKSVNTGVDTSKYKLKTTNENVEFTNKKSEKEQTYIDFSEGI